ncbi:hypothetical protein BY458DRAFT_527678 [Sporodiniella umbellata]|nr:hypothetical protein BY458DRAFT_527678 [Sporodiniella umbellata]
MYFCNQDKDDSTVYDSSGYNFAETENLFGQSLQDFYDDNSFLNFDMQHSSQSLPSSFFPPPDEFQQSILFSDPNFLRQQQLIEKAEMDIKEEEVKEEPSAVRSNLSAMLDQSYEEKRYLQSDTTSQIKLEPIPKKKPVYPSKTSTLNTEGNVDHQRRFSELQARFRINYNKKTPKQQMEESALLNKRKAILDPSLNKNIIKLNNRDVKKLNTAQTAAKKMMPLQTASACGMTIPQNNPQEKFFIPGAHSLPSRTMPIQIQRVQRSNGNQPFDLEQRQKRLDDMLVKVDFNDITVSELKEMLRQRGKLATGKKAVLLQRLQEERDFILHARAKGMPIASRYLNPSSPVTDSSSLPDTMYLSSSPASLGSLNRSIANMHIGSPPPSSLSIPSAPVNTNRRFTPYISQRNSSSSASHSSSVPSSGFLYKKSYAPFTSSALATPDRDDDINPFDQLNETPNPTGLDHTMEWADPSLEVMLQQQLQQQDFEHKFTDEEIMSFLANQQDPNSFNDAHNFFHQPSLEDYQFHHHS